MNKRLSHRHNPFKSGPSNQGNRNFQNDNQQENQNASQSQNRSYDGHGSHSSNHGNRNFQQNEFQQDKNNSPKNRQFHNGPHNKNSTQSPPEGDAPPSGPCVQCKSSTVLICSRCGDFYCSPTCQKNDWQTHRFICFLMPKLVSSSVDIYQNIPVLNGYQNRELPDTATNSGLQSQNKKWVNNSPTPSPAMQQNQPQQQYNQNQRNQHQSNQRQVQPQQQQRQQQPMHNNDQNPHQSSQRQPQQQQRQQQQQQQHHQNDQTSQQNRRTPPKSTPGSDKSHDADANKATNIGRVKQSPFPKNNSAVCVTAIRSSNRIFLRSLDKEENDAYCAVLKSINEYGRNATPLTCLPTKNAFVITDFNKDGLYYRVQVVAVRDENNIQVIYYDFGNEATKKLSELKDISLECAGLKQCVVMATLKNVPFIKDNPKLIEYMKSFEDIEAKVVYNEREKPMCDIILEGEEDSLNKKVNVYIQNTKIDSEQHKSKRTEQPQQQQQQPRQAKENIPPEKKPVAPPVVAKPAPKTRPSQFSKAVMVPPFEQIALPVGGKNLNVMIVDSSLLHYNCLGCMLAEDTANLQEIQNYLNDYEDNGREYKPKIEEYCLAKYQDGWYRAKVLTLLSSEVVEVVFIDFLNESEVFIKDIRRYPMDLDMPCKTTLCLIEGLPSELTENQVEYLKDKLQPGTEIKINEVVEKHDDGSEIAVCKINKVMEWMAADKP